MVIRLIANTLICPLGMPEYIPYCSSFGSVGGCFTGCCFDLMAGRLSIPLRLVFCLSDYSMGSSAALRDPAVATAAMTATSESDL